MWKKISCIAVIALILVTYNHCGMPKSASKKGSLSLDNSSGVGKSSTNPTVEVVNGSANDIEIFSQTVWPLTKQYCASCHGTSQQPLHGSSDVNIAYKAIIDGFKVNFSNPSSSRMVLKLKDENHNCWSNCTDNSNELLDQVLIWSEQRGVSTSDNDSEKDSFITEESMSLDQTLNTNDRTGSMKFEPLAMILNQYFFRGNSGDINYIYSKGSGVLRSRSDNKAGSAFINFTVNRTAAYHMWALVDAKTASDDSFYVKFNNGPYVEWHIPETNGFEWIKVTDKPERSLVSFFAQQGSQNQLEIKEREDGAKISTVVLSDDIEQNSELLNLSTAVTFRYDISSMLNLGDNTIILEIDCRDFDEYTYQFYNPRVISTSNSNIKIKGLKLHINGSYNPQHSTYNFINTVISRGTNVLSESSLLAIKDRGSSDDRFSFSFDEIELQ